MPWWGIVLIVLGVGMVTFFGTVYYIGKDMFKF